MRISHSSSRHHRRAFTIVETMIVMAFALGIAISATVVYGSATSSDRVEQAQVWLGQTAQTARQSYASSADFSTLTQASATQDSLFPSAAMAGGNGPTNPWGGDFAISGVTSSMGPALVITYDQVPIADCAKIASVMANSAVEITVGGTEVANGPGSTQSVPAIAAACDAEQQSGGTDLMQFFFLKRA
jgi:type II secretory pathway pseudopilin PulG